MNVFSFINIALLALFNFELILCSKCGVDKLHIMPKAINITQSAKKTSASKAVSYTPISIGYDFSNLEKPSSMGSSTFENVKSILKETRVEFSKILQVQHENIDLSSYLRQIKDVCQIDIIGDDYKNFLIKNDLIIFPKFDDLGNEVLAAAAPCITNNDFRPIAGILYLNSKLNFGVKNTNLYMKNLLLHEISHILGFHPYFFTVLEMSSVEGSMSYITSKKVRDKAREHFGCTTLSGIPLENQGGEGSVGSHWESRHMLGDYMISTDYPEQAISDITLALFEDTGFYKVNYYSGGLFKFGKNKGCSFINKKCVINEVPSFDEFCVNKDEPKCGSSRTVKSRCYITEYSNIPSQYQYFSDKSLGGFFAADYCPVPLLYESSNDYYPNHCQVGKKNSSYAYGETIGNDSLCFMSSLIQDSSTNSADSKIPVCYKVSCDTNNNQIIITIGDKQVKCPKGGNSNFAPDGFKGSIECPKYEDVCSSNDGLVCNEMFSCLTELSSKNNYNYETSYYDSDDTVMDYIQPIKINGRFNLEINLISLIVGIILLVC